MLDDVSILLYFSSSWEFIMNMWMAIGGVIGACCTGVSHVYEYSQQQRDRETQEQRDVNHQEVVSDVNEQRHHHPTLEEMIDSQLNKNNGDVDTEIDIKIEIHSHTRDSKESKD